MSDKKYQIFISSTYKDLKEARESVTKSILDMYHIPIGMEMFSADNNAQWETIKTTIDNSDFYVLIVGHRYGSVTKEGISFTEKEHDYGREIGVPILTFIRHRDVPVSQDQLDKETVKKKKLDSFINKVSTDTLVSFWNDKFDLTLKVSIALTKSFDKYNRAGWVRANIIPPLFAEEKKSLIKKNTALKEKFKVLDAEVVRQKRNLDLINHHLEEIIDERTKDLQIKNKKLSEFFAYYSNQIRGPIATIKGLLSLEKENVVDKTEFIDMLNKTVSEIDHTIIETIDVLNYKSKEEF